MAVNINRYILRGIRCSTKQIFGLFVINICITYVIAYICYIYAFENINLKLRFTNKLQLPHENLHDYLKQQSDRRSQRTIYSNQDFPHRDLFRRQRITVMNCLNLIKGEEKELRKNRTFYISSNNMKNIPWISKPCKEFIQERNYITSSLTKEEEMFPIAYSMLVYKDAPQVERLLRAIYRPQNVYCIHIDRKSNPSFKKVVVNIASCFYNVFISSRSVNVYWGKFTNLEPELICMEDLLKYKKWKYFINLTGQEFPLRTNYQLVKVLKILNGANDIAGSIYETKQSRGRWLKAGKPPHNISPVKGSVHITASRKFVEYVQYNQTAKDFLEWAKKTDHPDETFFNSLNHNPQLLVPGSNKGELEMYETKHLSRYKLWVTDNNMKDCHGNWVRGICIFGVDDLPLLSVRPELFANKFHLDNQPLTLDCLEELIYNRTRDEYLQLTHFNTTFYENLEYYKV